MATCMAILQVGSGLQLRTASTGSKEEDYENDAATIVQKCVSGIFADPASLASLDFQLIKNCGLVFSTVGNLRHDWTSHQ